ncbi:MAG TPA: TIGR03118 family protein, partial [Rhizomicrobium sp.]|nr:TIGR03118 family protein [Rhizomicrobium sp.]
SFKDRSLPAHFGPFNVMVDENSVYVAFAQHSKDGDEVKGAGLGYIDVFRKDGHLKTHLVANGALNAPWGMAIAPSTFGEFAGALLVGNFGDGKINAYDRNTGEFLGALSDSTGTPIVINGLWGIEARPLGKITFAAGPGDEAHGLLGSITPITQTALK